MPKWWKRNIRSQHLPTVNAMTSANEDETKKKSRSLVSFFLDQPQPAIAETKSDRKSLNNDWTLPNRSTIDVDRSLQKRDPTWTYYQKQSLIPYAPTYHHTQIPIPDHLEVNHPFTGYLQLFDQLFNESNSCFGVSLFDTNSKYCLYMTVMVFLGICLMISSAAILRK